VETFERIDRKSGVFIGVFKFFCFSFGGFLKRRRRRRTKEARNISYFVRCGVGRWMGVGFGVERNKIKKKSRSRHFSIREKALSKICEWMDLSLIRISH